MDRSYLEVGKSRVIERTSTNTELVSELVPLMVIIRANRFVFAYLGIIVGGYQPAPLAGEFVMSSLGKAFQVFITLGLLLLSFVSIIYDRIKRRGQLIISNPFFCLLTAEHTINVIV
jgi:hypothetical protein